MDGWPGLTILLYPLLLPMVFLFQLIIEHWLGLTVELETISSFPINLPQRLDMKYSKLKAVWEMCGVWSMEFGVRECVCPEGKKSNPGFPFSHHDVQNRTERT